MAVPFLIIECRDDIPAESKQCFLAAGLVAVFHRTGEAYPFGVEFIGIRGSSEAPLLPTAIELDLKPCHIPQLKSLEHVYNLIPKATHVSNYPHQMLFEIE